jgi:hypothetical protein
VNVLDENVPLKTRKQPQLTLHSKSEQGFSLSSLRGGEGWGEEGRLAYKQRSRQHRGTPLSARSSRGEGVGALHYPTASSVSLLMPVFPKRRNADVTEKPQAPERQQNERAGLWNRGYGSQVAARDANQCGCGRRQINAVKRIRG